MKRPLEILSQTEVTLTATMQKEKKQRSHEEELLQEDNTRLAMFPIKHKELFQHYKKQLALFWTTDEIPFDKDQLQWKYNLNDNQKKFIKYILAFFAVSDGLVNINLLERFLSEMPLLEARLNYTFQAAIENIHAETYSEFINKLVEDDEKDLLYNAVENFPCIKKKTDWAYRWIESDKSLAHRILGFSIFEGIYFSGAFCSIYWLKDLNLMPGLCMANEFIQRDEGTHFETAVIIYRNYIKNKLPWEEVKEMFKEAVDIEKEFVCESLPVDMIGMNKRLMSKYIEWVCNDCLVRLGYPKLYQVDKCPFPFMENISLDNNTNFFEGRVSSYQKADVMASGNKKKYELIDDDDF